MKLCQAKCRWVEPACVLVSYREKEAVEAGRPGEGGGGMSHFACLRRDPRTLFIPAFSPVLHLQVSCAPKAGCSFFQGLTRLGGVLTRNCCRVSVLLLIVTVTALATGLAMELHRKEIDCVFKRKNSVVTHASAVSTADRVVDTQGCQGERWRRVPRVRGTMLLVRAGRTPHPMFIVGMQPIMAGQRKSAF